MKEFLFRQQIPTSLKTLSTTSSRLAVRQRGSIHNLLYISASHPAKWGPDAGVKGGGGRNGRPCLLPQSGGVRLQLGGI